MRELVLQDQRQSAQMRTCSHERQRNGDGHGFAAFCTSRASAWRALGGVRLPGVLLEDNSVAWVNAEPRACRRSVVAGRADSCHAVLSSTWRSSDYA